MLNTNAVYLSVVHKEDTKRNIS